MALSRNIATAEDLVQETCLRALSAKNPLRPDSNHKSWLFTILRNIFLNELRKGRWTSGADARPAGQAALSVEGQDQQCALIRRDQPEERSPVQQQGTGAGAGAAIIAAPIRRDPCAGASGPQS